MFAFLQESIKKSYDTSPLCASYRDCNGEPMQMHVQMDVDEFMNQLFDRLENCLKGTSRPTLLRDHFGGKLIQQIISKVRTSKQNRILFYYSLYYYYSFFSPCSSSCSCCDLLCGAI